MSLQRKVSLKSGISTFRVSLPCLNKEGNSFAVAVTHLEVIIGRFMSWLKQPLKGTLGSCLEAVLSTPLSALFTLKATEGLAEQDGQQFCTWGTGEVRSARPRCSKYPRELERCSSVFRGRHEGTGSLKWIQGCCRAEWTPPSMRSPEVQTRLLALVSDQELLPLIPLNPSACLYCCLLCGPSQSLFTPNTKSHLIWCQTLHLSIYIMDNTTLEIKYVKS